MNQEYAIENFINELRLIIDNQISIMLDFSSKCSSYSLKEQTAISLLQMTISNVCSIMQLSKGIAISKSFAIIDPISLIPLLRTIYERTYMFHNIFIEPETDIEKNIIFNIWRIRGLNNRKNVENTPQKYKKKAERELTIIEELKREIDTFIEQINISEHAKSQIVKAYSNDSSMTEGYLFIYDESGKITKFERISFSKSPKFLLGEKLNKIYSLLSLNTHPSYLSVLQFKDMNENSINSFLKMIFEGIIIYNGIFFRDLCNIIPEGNVYLNELKNKGCTLFNKIEFE